MLWEAVFLLVVLKIPLVYLCLVVWWAIRAEPRDDQPAVATAVTDTPSPPALPSAPAGRTRPPRTHGPRRHGYARRERVARGAVASRGDARR